MKTTTTTTTCDSCGGEFDLEESPTSYPWTSFLFRGEDREFAVNVHLDIRDNADAVDGTVQDLCRPCAFALIHRIGERMTRAGVERTWGGRAF